MDRFDRFRWLEQRLPRDKRRLVVLTGARQTGKTTLARRCYQGLEHHNLDDLQLRTVLRDTPATRWAKDVGPAVFDEAQKEPSIFDKVKFAYDAGDLDASVLLGSSRILLLDRVRETLAGRAFVFDLWPLMPNEVRHAATDEPEPALLDRLLTVGEIGAVLADAPAQLLPSDDDSRWSAFEHVLRWGGMPELLRLADEDRRQWLRSYAQTFLERDLMDLARLHDLEPFAALQRMCMLRSGELLNYASIARDAKISAKTAQRYLEYLRLSYQVLLLQPFATNLTSRVVKSPKVYWVDLGLLRQATKQWHTEGGELFETAVVVEVHKWISTLGREASLSFYRTTSGLEVDLLIETERGVVGIEVKDRDGSDRSDARGLRAVAKELGDRWLGGMVVHHGRRIEAIDAPLQIWGVPAHRLLS